MTEGSWSLRPVTEVAKKPGQKKLCHETVLTLCNLCTLSTMGLSHVSAISNLHPFWPSSLIRDISPGFQRWHKCKLLMPFCVNTDALKHTTH